MKTVLVILSGVFLIYVLWYGYSSLIKGESMRFIPVGQVEDGNKELVMAANFSEGGEWINSPALNLAGLRGKVVLVDFWTYSCINCQRTIPYIQSWWKKYKDQGLVIVGVHTPEFEFEKDTDNVKSAMEKYGVDWPVVQDNDYKIWKAYKNQFWPHKYLIDQEGKIVYDHIGEGGYEETEREIQKLLKATDMAVVEEPKSGAIGFGMKQTPELYVNQRGKFSGQIGKGQDRVELLGDWKIEEEYSGAGDDAGIRLEYQAGEVNLVMSLPDETKRTVSYRVDEGEERTISVGVDDLYQVWEGKFGKHKLDFEVEKGVRVHAFTFGK